MFLTAAICLFVPLLAFRSLRSSAYGLHLVLVLAGLWLYQQQSGVAPALFSLGAVYPLLMAHLLIGNLLTFGLYGYDKACARSGRRRVPERRLQAFAFIGGSIGALLGQKIFRHKTRKSNFQVVFLLIFFLQILVLLVLATVYYG